MFNPKFRNALLVYLDDDNTVVFSINALMPRVGAVDSMPHELKFILKHILDNVFWAFLILMIIAGSAIDAPFVNVGLTAR